jgi:hypothetical protein
MTSTHAFASRRAKLASSVSFVLLGLTAGQAHAFGNYGTQIDAFCASVNGATPYQDQSCDLCHSGGFGNYVSPAWDWWYDSNQWSNFCGNVVAPNEAPVLDTIGNQAINQLETLAFTITATDPDGNNLSFTASGLPTGATFTDNGNGTASFSWTPSVDQSGNYPITFTVTDDGDPVASDSEEITVSVGIANNPPVLDTIGPQDATVDTELSFTVSATDPDNDGLILTAANLPVGATFTDNLDGSGTFTWTPAAGQEGGHNVLFSVTDTGVPQGTDTEEVAITVAGGNAAPVLNPIGNQTAQLDVELALNISATDADGDALTFNADNLPLSATFTDNGDGTAAFSWTPTAGDIGQVVTFSVSDDYTPPGSDSEDVTITLEGVNQPPVLDTIGNQNAYVDEALQLTFTGSDPDGDAISFSADPLPTGATLIDNTDGTATFSWIPAADQIGDHTLTVTITDSGDPVASDAEEFTINVMSRDLTVITGEVDIRHAYYHGRRGKLKVFGRGEPGAIVDVTDSDTGELLGSTTVNEDGRWKVRVYDLDEAPESVTATNGGFSDTEEVRDRHHRRHGKRHHRDHDRKHGRDRHDDDDHDNGYDYSWGPATEGYDYSNGRKDHDHDD